MNKRICYTLAGNLSVVVPCPIERLVSRIVWGDGRVSGMVVESAIWVSIAKLLGRSSMPTELMVMVGETDDEFAARIQAKDVPAGATGVRIIDVADLPNDRYFRNAWADNGTAIRIPITGARGVHKQRLMERRDAVMPKLRDKIEAAEDAGDAVLLVSLKAKRAALRNIATKINTDLSAINTLAGIKAYAPTEITEQE